MTITIPDEILPAGLSEADLRRELAIVLYQLEKLSLGRAAHFAGMKKFEFNGLLADRGIPMHYGMQELESDLATARSLAAGVIGQAVRHAGE